MSKNNEIRSAGLKVTHARKRILEVLETSKKSHLSADDINKILIKNNDEVSGGSTILPNNSGLVVRLMCNSSEIIKTEIYDIVRIVRKEILDAEFTGIRKT